MTAGRLRGAVVIVTGAAKGIGRGIADVCASEGASTVLVDRDSAFVPAGAGVTVVGDVTDESVVAETVQSALHRYGRITGLVNNAAVLHEASTIETTREQWEETITTNLTAPWLWAKAVIPAMLADGGGSIVNIASIEATRVRADHAAYVAAKSGLLGLTRGIAVDYGRRGVRCNAISPGSIDTEMFRHYVGLSPDPEALEATLVGMNYVGRLGTAAEVGTLAAYLLSEESGFVNGADFVIDGGRIAAT